MGLNLNEQLRSKKGGDWLLGGLRSTSFLSAPGFSQHQVGFHEGSCLKCLLKIFFIQTVSKLSYLLHAM